MLSQDSQASHVGKDIFWKSCQVVLVQSPVSEEQKCTYNTVERLESRVLTGFPNLAKEGARP